MNHADRLSHVTAVVTNPQFRDIVELARRSELPLEVALSIYRDPLRDRQSERAPVQSELDVGASVKLLPTKSAMFTVKLISKHRQILHCHGHWHSRYDRQHKTGTHVVGLDCNMARFEDAVLLWSRETP